MQVGTGTSSARCPCPVFPRSKESRLCLHAISTSLVASASSCLEVSSRNEFLHGVESPTFSEFHVPLVVGGVVVAFFELKNDVFAMLLERVQEGLMFNDGVVEGEYPLFCLSCVSHGHVRWNCG